MMIKNSVGKRISGASAVDLAKLPVDLKKLVDLDLSESELLAAIKMRRSALREHRDQKGDDRCWLDDFRIWAFIEGSPEPPVKLPPFKKMMRLCRDFFLLCRADEADPVPKDAILDRRHRDRDLAVIRRSKEFVKGRLLIVLSEMQRAIFRHREIKDRRRTIDDHRSLYAALPEKIPADFRLPSEGEFLGEDAKGRKPPAGCQFFWKSHSACADRKKCNVHGWGPCKE